MKKKVVLSMICVMYISVLMAQITQQQTIGAPHTQVTNRGFFASDSAIRANADTIRSARIGSIAVIGTQWWIQAVHNVTDSSWQTNAAGSAGLSGLNIGALDSLSAVSNGLQVINSTTLPVVYGQSVNIFGKPGFVKTIDYNHFLTTYRFFQNTKGTNFVAYPDTAVHAFPSTGDNVVIGSNAMTTVGSSIRNIALGSFALTAPSSGGNNVAIGFAAVESSVSGSDLIGMGTGALANERTASDIIAIGGGALQQENGGSGNVAIGFHAMIQCGNCSSNTAVGDQAMSNITTGVQNVAVGMLSVNRESTGSGNTGVGYGSISGNTTGGNNTGVGNLAMDFNTIGNGNTAVGSGALAQDSIASNCVAVGLSAMQGFGDTNCIAIGKSSLYGIYPNAGNGTLGSNRTIAIGDSIGFFSSVFGTGGARFKGCILVGNSITQVSVVDTSRINCTVIGNDLKPDTDNLVMIGTPTQVVRIGGNGMSGASFNALPSHASNMQYVTDSNTYVMDDGSYRYKWRKVITGSFSQSVTAVTTFTVNLPTAIAGSAYIVTITPTAALSATAYYVSSKGPSSFNVTFISALTGTVMFDWELVVN